LHNKQSWAYLVLLRCRSFGRESGLKTCTADWHQATWNKRLYTFGRYETACRLVGNYRQCEGTYCRYSHVSCGPTTETEENGIFRNVWQLREDRIFNYTAVGQHGSHYPTNWQCTWPI